MGLTPLTAARRVVVTGLGCIGPCGNDVPTMWQAMLDGRSGIGPITRFDASAYATRIAGEVRDFDVASELGPRVARRSGRFMHYAMAAADEAMRDAGFDVDGQLEGNPSHWPDGDRLGTYLGSGIGGLVEIVGGAQEPDPKRTSPLFIPRSLINLANGGVAIRYRARGPGLVVATACAVGNHAIGEAWRAIRDDDADVIVAGGTEAALCPLGLAGFMNMKALSKRNDAPREASRPFDRDRDGFVMSEGAGVVVLESLEHATARGADIYCELRGYATTTDAHHVTAPAPGGAGAARCMALALKKAHVAPEQVGYINAHGTSTPANDVAETQAIRTAFGAAADRLAVSSTKGVTGHLLGAAGGVEAIATILAIRHQRIPPTANHQHPDPACDLDYVPGSARDASLDAAVSNGFGFGGTNAVLVFGRI